MSAATDSRSWRAAEQTVSLHGTSNRCFRPVADSHPAPAGNCIQRQPSVDWAKSSFGLCLFHISSRGIKTSSRAARKCSKWAMVDSRPIKTAQSAANCEALRAGPPAQEKDPKVPADQCAQRDRWPYRNDLKMTHKRPYIGRPHEHAKGDRDIQIRRLFRRFGQGADGSQKAFGRRQELT